MNTHPTQLFALLFNEGKIEQLAAALEQMRVRMEEAGESHLWQFWQAAMLAGRGDFSSAEAAATKLTGAAAVEARRLIVLHRAKSENNWEPAIEFFKKQWEGTKSPSDLFALCEVQMNKGQPAFVAEHAEELVRAVGTPAALQIAVAGAVRIGAWRKCLELLTQHTEIFPNRQLPTDMRRLRITCEQHLGMLSDAAQHAEELVREENTAENVALLFNLRVSAGQLKEATLPAKQLIQNPKTPAETLVRLGWVMRLEDPALSGAALRQAVERGISGPEAVGGATILAHQLQMHDLLPQLFPKMAAEAQKPNPFLRTADITEMIDWTRKNSEQAREAFERLRSGRLPIHFLRRAINVPLAFWPIMALAHRGSAGELSPHLPVFFRHGGRATESEPLMIRRLFLDITAYVNAYEIGLLPLVEKIFGPLVIPPSLRTSLVQQLDDASQAQPDVSEARASVIRLLNEKRIDIWVPSCDTSGKTLWREGVSHDWWLAADEVLERKGLLVDCWPKLKQDGNPFVPPMELLPRLTTAIALVTALRREGAISESEERQAKAELASVSAGLETEQEPKKGQVLFLDGIMAETLAHAQILEPLSKIFTLVVGERDASWIRYQQQLSTWREQLANHLNGMLQHLRTSSAYSDLVLRETSEALGSDQSLDASESCLTDLIQAEPGEGHWVWIDDRLINTYNKCGEVPIITTLEILDALRQGNHVTSEDYFAYRHRLRMADFRFVPLSKEEIAFHLRQAPIRDERIVETPELAVLRRYLARIILDRGALQIPPLDFETPKPEGEHGFLVAGMLATVDALADVFNDTVSDGKTCYARADWLAHALWCVPEHFAEMLGRAANKPDATQSRGAGDALLLSKALNQRALSSVETASRYMTWLERNMLCEFDRQQMAADQVRALLEREVGRKARNTLEQKVWAHVMRSWYSALPKPIRKKINLTAHLKRILEIGHQRVITVGEAQFDAAKFWETAEKAYSKTGESKISALGNKVLYSMRIERRQAHPLLLLQKEGQEQPWGIEDAVLNLLNPKRQMRLAALRRHPEWLDGLATDFKEECDRIASLPTSEKRISAVDEFRKRSLWHQYMMLEKLSATDKGPTLDQMMPTGQKSFISFLRLPNELVSQSLFDWENVGECLVKQVGLEETFLRLAHLPRELPASFLRAFDKQPPKARHRLLSTLDTSNRSPLTRTHILRLKLRMQWAKSGIIAAGEALLNESMLVEAQALLKLVHWAWNNPGRSNAEPAGAGISRLALAWIHGGRLFEILRGISKPAHLLEFFDKYDRVSRTEFLVGVEGEDDVAFPRNVSPRTLLITSVAAALKSEGVSTAGLSGQMQELGRSLCIERKDNIAWPRLDWLYDTETFSNVLGSSLGQPREQLLTAILGEQDVNAFSSRELRNQLDALITSLEEDAAKESSWTLLGLVLRGRPCPAVLRARLRGLMERVNFIALPFVEPVRYATLLALAVQAWPLGGDDLVKRWQQVIVSFAAWLGGQAGTLEDRNRRQQMLLHCIQGLARPSPRSETMRIFVSAALASSQKWSDFDSTLAQLLPLLLSLPDEQLAAAWPLILHIRRDGFVTPRRT